MIFSQVAIVSFSTLLVSSIKRLVEFGSCVSFEHSLLSSFPFFYFCGESLPFSGARANMAVLKTKTDVVDLDSSNFDSIALDKTKDVLVEFYAPCKNIQYALNS